MSYSIDFSKITLGQYRKELAEKSFIPSRQILKDKAEIHFAVFTKSGMKSLADLFAALKNSKMKTELLKNKDISEEYLTILFRELKSILPKPLKLSEFSWIPLETINKLETEGIYNTELLYEKLLKSDARKHFAKSTGISKHDLTELLKLSDLTRIQWVNTTFAHVLYAAGFDTVKKVSNTNPDDLFAKVKQKNNELGLYKGNIGQNDMKLCIEASKILDAEIEV